MKTFCTVLTALLALGVAHGQNYNDALRYSFVFPQGSARFAGTGGSLTPMGVDVTTLHTNPAGIGWNRYSMAQVTPGFSLTNTGATLDFGDNASTSDGTATFTLPSAGIVFAGNTRSVNWSTLNFGISMTRLADYNQQISFSGRSPGGIIESFAELADIGVNDEYGVNLANDFLIDLDGRVYSDFTDFNSPDLLNFGESINRDGLYDRRGSMNEVAIGFGGNYREKLLWGLSFGIPFVSYDEVLTYNEVDDQSLIPAFESSVYNQNLNVSGTGFNLKTGITWLPTEQLRLSAAVHSPTFWAIDEQYSTTFEYNFLDEDNVAAGGRNLSPLAAYTYNLRTPWRFSLGGGYLIGNRGFISVDADYMNYTSNTISFDDFATANDAANADIEALLGSSIGVRVGGELNLKPLQVRAGVGYRQIPFTDYLNDEDQGMLTYSAGAGYSVGKFFADLTAQYQGYSTFQSPYETLAVSGQTILTDRTRVSLLLTVGFRGFTAGF